MNNETTASQPKSIGDDAQFLSLMGYLAVSAKNAHTPNDADYYKSLFQQVITYIDSRASADQASATIQTAPDLSSLRIHTGRDLQGAWLADQEKFVKLSDVEALLVATIQEPVMVAEPVEMILHCPTCHVQHVDAPDERTADWTNPPHRSHLCHACGCIWRPSDVPTSGVAAIKTSGKADTAMPAVELNGGMHASIFTKVWGDAGGGDAGRIALANYAFNLGSHSAAPMVVDPAGVELAAQAIFKLLGGNPGVVWVPGGNSFKQDEARDYARAALAATVKAVPSEALEDAGWFGSAETVPSSAAADHEAALEAGDFAEAARIRGNAAPPADKTGGGE